MQSGAVLAVLPLFRRRLAQFVFDWRAPETMAYMAKLALAFVITGIGGFILEKRGFKLPETELPIASALLIGGVGFLLVEEWLKRRVLSATISWSVAVAMGLAQLLAAVFPGASRSGACILLALILGLSRPAATEFAFLLGVPTMLAAGGLKCLHACRHPAAGAPPENWPLVGVGFVVAALVSFVVVKWLLGYVQHHTFKVFGWYRIALALLVFALLGAG
jgi:undecaprenyl-diphosphatase